MPDLLVEIRTEEIPALRVRPAAEALRDGLAARLAEAGLLEGWKPEGQPILGTPRRLAAFIPGLRERQPDREERVWGPPVAAAFGPDGKPTKAGEGFARSSGVPLERMGRGEKVPGKPHYLFADRTVKGRTAAEVIAEALPAVAVGLPFKRTMRWPQSDTPFARPARGLVVLLGKDVVPCRFAGCEAGRTTRGHVFLRVTEVELPAADVAAYRSALKRAKVIVDFGDRAALVKKQVRAVRAEALGTKGGPWSETDDDLLAEVAGLVEWPSALTGTFDPKYRQLPPALLVTAMAHHLRYFPVVDGEGAVREQFASVTDREPRSADRIRPGNERVLRARLYDADFFFGNDRKRKLLDFRDGLAGMDFHKGLGTLRDKSDRVVRIASQLCDKLGVPTDVRQQVESAAILLKCDLLTDVVKEFPELQGRIGAFYAKADGETDSVARAIEGQYLPRGEWDPVLDDDVAALVSVAEKADSLAAYFSIDEGPTGSADPFGLRRHALGILRILERKRWPLATTDVLRPACEVNGRLETQRCEELDHFLWDRARQEMRQRGFVDFIDAVGFWYADHAFPYWEFWSRMETLRSLSRRPLWKDLIALVERTGNMGELAGWQPGPQDAFDRPPEVQAVETALESAIETSGATSDLVVFSEKYLRALGVPVNTMFEKVLVDNPKEPLLRRWIKAKLHEAFLLFAGRLGDLRLLGSGARPPRA